MVVVVLDGVVLVGFVGFGGGNGVALGVVGGRNDVGDEAADMEGEGEQQ